MRISDWSSDVCSSDLRAVRRADGGLRAPAEGPAAPWRAPLSSPVRRDRKSVGEGKSVSVRVDLGGRRLIKKNRQYTLMLLRSGIHVHQIIDRSSSKCRASLP